MVGKQMVQSRFSPGDAKFEAILIVDDHPLYCDALTSALKNICAPRTIETASTLGEAMRLLSARFAPDLIVLDLNLPDVTGISGLISIKKKVPEIPVLIISATSSRQLASALLSAGAIGFVPKESPREVLETALGQISQGKIFIPVEYRQIFEADCKGYSSKLQQLSRKIASLTPQQSRMLALICEGKLNKQIAYEVSLAEATVKAHVTAMFRRLGVQNRTQAALLVKEATIAGGFLTDHRNKSQDGTEGA